MRAHLRWGVLALACLFAACSDSELVGIHLKIAKDGSGTLTVRALQSSTTPGPGEMRAQGVQWQARAFLVSSQGAFHQVDDVAFGKDKDELRFKWGSKADDMPHLRVFVKRSPDLTWVQSLVPGDQAIRRDLARVHDPTGKTREIGEAIRLEVQVPDTVVSTGVQPAGRGIDTQHERNVAYLVLPVQNLLEKGDELVWDVSWK
jgi:hypothetical protein